MWRGFSFSPQHLRPSMQCASSTVRSPSTGAWRTFTRSCSSWALSLYCRRFEVDAMNSLITQDRSHLAYRGLDDRFAGRATCLDRESRCTKTNAMNVKRNGRQSMKCEACDDTGWVCGTHEADPATAAATRASGLARVPLSVSSSHFFVFRQDS